MNNLIFLRCSIEQNTFQSKGCSHRACVTRARRPVLSSQSIPINKSLVPRHTESGNAPLLPWARNSHLSTAGAGRPGPRLPAARSSSSLHWVLFRFMHHHACNAHVQRNYSTSIALRSLHSFLVGVVALGSPTHSVTRHNSQAKAITLFAVLWLVAGADLL